MKWLLIADSGGTKTDWCLIDNKGNKQKYTTESYHPVNWGDEFFSRIRLYWEGISEKKSIELYFFGAGCFHEKNKIQLTAFFYTLGFKSVSVSSDLHGAAISSLGDENGQVAILGTGSVLFEWRNQEVVNIVGGIGHLLGDEGSGYYFGKIVLEAFLNNSMNENQKAIINELNISSFDLTDKFNIAKLAFQLSHEKECFKSYHYENIQKFINTHGLENTQFNIAIIGSYAFHHQSFFEKVFRKNGVGVSCFIEKPISLLVDQKDNFID